jgi:type IV pilus assembly protein PilE
MNSRSARRPSSRTRSAGFTLVELMVAVVIIGILAAFALPSYQSSLRRTQRGDAYIALATVADALELAYNNQLAPRSYPTDIVALGLSATSVSGYYDLTVASCDAGTLADCYKIDAVARNDGPQWKDVDCRSFTVDSRGSRSSSPDSNGCWRK